MYKQIKDILNQDRLSFPLRDYPQEEEVMAQQQIVDMTQFPAMMEPTGADVSTQQPFEIDDLIMDQPENIQYFANTNVESFAAAPVEQPVLRIPEMIEKISDLEKSNLSLHSKIDNLTLELQSFKKSLSFTSTTGFQEPNQTAKMEQQQQKSPKNVKFADEDVAVKSKKRPSSSDEQQQPAAKKIAFDDNTIAFSHKFTKGKATPTKEKEINFVQDLIFVLVWLKKITIEVREILNIKTISLSELDANNIGGYAYKFARWITSLTENLTAKENKVIRKLITNIRTADLQNFKTGSAFCNSETAKAYLEADSTLFDDFGPRKLTKLSYISTLLTIFTKHGSAIVDLLRAQAKVKNSGDKDLIFKKLYSVLTATKYATEVGNLACICTSCKIRVLDVFCSSCKYMSVCSVCYNNSPYAQCAVCRTNITKIEYGYNSTTPINADDKLTSVLFSNSVRTIPRLQTVTQEFGPKHKTSGLIGTTCNTELKASKDELASKPFASFITTAEKTVTKTLGAVEVYLKQGNSKGLRLCDSCRSTVATKRLRYQPVNERETVIAVCDGCFEDKTDVAEDNSPFIRFTKDTLYRGAKMNVTAATLQLDLSSVPLDVRHQDYLKRENKRSNVDVVCSEYKIDVQSKSQENSLLTLKTVMKQIVAWGANPEHDVKDYYNFVNERIALCWPVNNKHLTQVSVVDNKVQINDGDVNRDLFFTGNDVELLKPQCHEQKTNKPHPYIKQILQVLKTDNEKNEGLKAVLRTSDVCVYDESVIVIGKLFNKLESSKLLSSLNAEYPNYCPIVGFYNKEFHPHPNTSKNRKQKKTPPSLSKKEEDEKEKDLVLSEGPSSDEEEEKKEEEKQQQQTQEIESAANTLAEIIEQN